MVEVPSVQYVTTGDRHSIAFASTGSGQPFVFMPVGLFNHVQIAWQVHSQTRRWLELLASRYTVIQYDHRGQGLSSRGLTKTHSMRDWVVDLESLLDSMGNQPVVLMGFSHL